MILAGWVGWAPAAPAPQNTVARPSSMAPARTCTDCETSWQGPTPCWVCDRPGEVIAELGAPQRQVWNFANAFHPNYEIAEGDPL